MKHKTSHKAFEGRILRLPEVIGRCGIKRGTIYVRMKANSFPRPIRLGVNSVGWLDSEINAWVEERISQSRNKNV